MTFEPTDVLRRHDVLHRHNETARSTDRPTVTDALVTDALVTDGLVADELVIDELLANAPLPDDLFAELPAELLAGAPARRLRVPASSANLGPGFDALGMAIGIFLECRFRPSASSPPTLTIRASGRDAELISLGSDNLIWSTAAQIAGRLGRTLPPVDLEIINDIPLGKGLGSSAAALTAGVVIADNLLGLRWPKKRILDEAARLEGHPDNVSACVLGSIVASAIDSLGVAHAVRMDLHPRFAIAVVVPDFLLPTVEARRVLPASYSRADVIFNIQRSTLLISALATGTVDAFPTALEDRMHQPYRAALVPGLQQITELRVKGLLGCALSGAGPSVLVFYERGYENVCQSVQHIFAAHGKDSEILFTDLATGGYEFL